MEVVTNTANKAMNMGTSLSPFAPALLYPSPLFGAFALENLRLIISNSIIQDIQKYTR